MRKRAIFDPQADRGAYEYALQMPAPTQVYTILFTARSGSSWLSDIITETQCMGSPQEWFNPRLMPSSTRAKGSRNLDEFTNAISRHNAYGGYFGFEITIHQLKATFGSGRKLLDYFPDTTFFSLIRKDIVAQAVSLFKLETTGISHTKNMSEQDVSRKDTEFRYDRDGLKRAIRHTLAAEIGQEAFFHNFNIQPIRLSYEGMTAMGKEQVCRFFADKLGAQMEQNPDAESRHRKIGTRKNDEFSERFRQEEKTFLAEIEDLRKAWLTRCEI